MEFLAYSTFNYIFCITVLGCYLFWTIKVTHHLIVRCARVEVILDPEWLPKTKVTQREVCNASHSINPLPQVNKNQMYFLRNIFYVANPAKVLSQGQL